MPAVAFGQWIARFHPQIEPVFACGNRALEREIYAHFGVEPHIVGLEGSFMSGGLRTRIKRVSQFVLAFGQVRTLVRDVVKPDACLLFGGYLSFLFLLDCVRRKVRVATQEQNAYAGRVTRLAAHLGVPVLAGWPQCRPLKESAFTETGTPIRAFELSSRDEAWKKLGLEGGPPRGTIMAVLAGSLGGVQGLFETRLASFEHGPELEDGAILFVGASNVYEKRGKRHYMPKTWDMAAVYSLADVVITRGGGSTLAELRALEIPSLVVPWPASADDHQRYNANMFKELAIGDLIDENEFDTDDFEKRLKKVCLKSSKKTSHQKPTVYNAAGKSCEALLRAVFPDI